MTIIYASVDILVLRFCLVDLTVGNARSNDNTPLQCPRILVWTENNASTHHFKIPPLLALRTSGSVGVPMMYRIIWTTMVQ